MGTFNRYTISIVFLFIFHLPVWWGGGGGVRNRLKDKGKTQGTKQNKLTVSCFVCSASFCSHSFSSLLLLVYRKTWLKWEYLYNIHMVSLYQLLNTIITDI